MSAGHDSADMAILAAASLAIWFVSGGVSRALTRGGASRGRALALGVAAPLPIMAVALVLMRTVAR